MNKSITTQSLSETDMRNIKFAVAELFFGLTRSNWVRGGSMGTARQRAMEQVRAFLSTKNPNNPVVKYIQKYLVEKYAPMFAQMNVTSFKRELPCPPEKINDSKKWGAHGVKGALDKINTCVQEFESRAGQSYFAAQKKVSEKIKALPVSDKDQSKESVSLESQKPIPKELSLDQLSELLRIKKQKIIEMAEQSNARPYAA